MPTYTHVQLSPITAPAVPTAHRTHTDAADHIMEVFHFPAAFRVMKMLYQVTETVANDTIAAVIALATADRDGTMVAHIAETETTLADTLAAANTIYEVTINGGQGQLIAEGLGVVAIQHTAGTDSGAVAGIVKVWAVVQPAEL